MLTKPGAIWDEAKSLYKEFDPKVRIRNKDMKISFGPVQDIDQKAEVSFTHFERVDDTDNFQGSQLSSAVLDELCQFASPHEVLSHPSLQRYYNPANDPNVDEAGGNLGRS